MANSQDSNAKCLLKDSFLNEPRRREVREGRKEKGRWLIIYSACLTGPRLCLALQASKLEAEPPDIRYQAEPSNE